MEPVAGGGGRAPIELEYRNGVVPAADVIAELYRAAPLHRPVEDPERLAAMYAGSNVILTAWDGPRLAGALRGWTDGAFDGYVCDLAVHPDYQGQGVGRELLARLAAFGPRVEWVLRASLLAKEYYEHLGWRWIERGWYLPRSE